MDNEIGVAVVKYTEKAKRAFMFEYGEGIYLKEGDTVIVPDVTGSEHEAIVIDTVSFDLRYESDKEELNRLLSVAGVELPLRRVIGKVVRTYFKYGEKENADEDDD